MVKSAKRYVSRLTKINNSDDSVDLPFTRTLKNNKDSNLIMRVDMTISGLKFVRNVDCRSRYL